MSKTIRNVLFGAGIITIFLVWLHLSWMRWPDCLIDFGNQLYIPWQINEGKVLYKDLHYVYGPLAQYFHALLFKIFGTSLFVLIISNFVLLFITTFVIYLLFNLLYGSFSAAVAIAIFLGVFAFGRYVIDVGDYNYICPYSNELIYGLTLSLTGLVVLGHWLKQPKTFHLAIIGAITGLVFLTKVEIIFAFGASLITAFILNAICVKVPFQVIIKRLLTLALFASMAPMVFLCYLSQHLSFLGAVKDILMPVGIIGKWITKDNQFINTISGFNNVTGNLLFITRSVCGYILGVLILGALSYVLTRFKKQRLVFFLILSSGIIFMAWQMPVIRIWLWERGVPVVLLALILIKYFIFLKSYKRKDVSKLIFEIVVLSYSLMMTFKILLNVNPGHFGFVLAVPGTIFLGMLLTTHIPYAGRKFYRPKVFRALALVLILGVLVVYFRYSKENYQYMNYRISRGADGFIAEDRSIDFKSDVVSFAVQWIYKNTSAADTLVCIPEGTMINYLARRVNPIGVLEFFPVVLAMEGEDKIIDLLERHPPSYIILFNRDMREHGGQSWGNDFGKKINQWIQENYKTVNPLYFKLESKANGNTNIPLAMFLKKIK